MPSRAIRSLFSTRFKSASGIWPCSWSCLVSCHEFLVSFDAASSVTDRLAGPQGGDVGAVDVVDPVADGVLVLGLQDSLGAGGGDRSGLALARDVERVGDVGINLARAAGRCSAELGTRRLGIGGAGRLDRRRGWIGGWPGGCRPGPWGFRRTWRGGRGCARA